MNSFRSVQRAIEFEIERQAAILDSGGAIEQETRGYVDATGHTVSQRSKEEAHDYRYFPEPDLPPLAISAERIERLSAELPELPDAKRDRLERDYDLAPTDARILVETRARADAFEETIALVGASDDERRTRARTVAHWFIGDVAAHLNELGVAAELADTKLTPKHIAELVVLLEEGTITATTAKEVLGAAFEGGELPRAIVDERGLGRGPRRRSDRPHRRQNRLRQPQGRGRLPRRQGQRDQVPARTGDARDARPRPIRTRRRRRCDRCSTA